MLNVAVRAARRAARIINRASLDLDTLKVASKQRNDFVSEMDVASEQAIIETLTSAYPGHAILAEESGHAANGQGADILEAENIWIIDPIDGTTNFIHGFPHYSISIGLMQRGVITQAVVYDPNRDELFTATRGAGAFLNDRRIRTSRRVRLDEALVATGFPFRMVGQLDEFMSTVRTVTLKAAGVRRSGSAALDLAYVASGRVDAFFEIGLMPWDVAAGSLLVSEAGGLAGNFTADGDFLFSQQMLAGCPKVFGAMVALLRDSPLAARPS